MINEKKILGVIPAKKYSRRLPVKNIREFNGVPLINVTLNQALKSKFIDVVVVNTDSQTIRELVDDKALVIDRSKHLIKDSYGAEPIAIDTIKQLKETYDIIVWLQVTSPLRTTQDIDNIIELFIRNKDVCIYSVYDDDVLPNGAVYVANVDYILNGGLFYSEYHLDFKVNTFYSMPFRRSVDINTLFDFHNAELLQKGKCGYDR